MAEAGASIFNRRASERLRSPDDLENYVHVTNPSVWVALAAMLTLIGGLFAWGIFGTITTNVVTTSVSVDGRVVCFLSKNDRGKVHVGDTATVENCAMTVSEVSEVPLSREEARALVKSDYLASVMVGDEWVYEVSFEGTMPANSDLPLETTIDIDRVAPISVIWGNPEDDVTLAES